VALTCDILSHSTALDAAGTERKIGRPVPTLGVPSLLERVPKLFHTHDHKSWEWGFSKATRARNGLRKDVEGVRLTAPDAPP
jgi:hypothetical protein